MVFENISPIKVKIENRIQEGILENREWEKRWSLEMDDVKKEEDTKNRRRKGELDKKFLKPTLNLP